MIKFFTYTVLGTCLLVSSFTPTPVHADDDVKRLLGGLAVGVLGLALEGGVQASEQEEAQQIATPSKPKLEYSKDVAQMQEKLKAAGFYNGAVDGLKGQNTIDAINEWETRYSVQSGDGRVNTMLSRDEVALLEQQIIDKGSVQVAENTAAQNSTTSNRPKKISEMRGFQAQDKLYGKVKQIVAYKDLGDACISYKERTGMFKEFNGQYRSFLDENLSENLNNVYSYDVNSLHKRAKCLGASEDAVGVLFTRAKAEFASSRMGVAQKSGFYAVTKNPAIEEQLVDDCNIFSFNLQNDYQDRLKSTFNDKTCE